jgi:hypothetical protein
VVLGIGDTIITDFNAYLIVSAYDFNLSDGENRANYILVDVRRGKIEGYYEELDEIKESHNILHVSKIY